ncbi:MAG: adenylate/guanylate cyclase domain-containing protein [Deltaproteobacteria bacterium]|nr:adenylate/guanylate cyclase domain-containing protein [Deltaproteobacteria bacterium]
MQPHSVERKLAAILSADVQGYSRLMDEDEEATLHTLTASRAVIDPLIHQHRGRIVGTAGDSVLAEFASVIDAVRCAVEIQQQLKARNTELPAQRRMEFRIGINLGDVMVEGEQIYGDGVNVAARLQGLADAGGIFISGTVYDQIENKLPLQYEYLGEQAVKNIARPVRVYRVLIEVPSPLVGEAGSSKFGVRSSESEGRSPEPRRVGLAHLKWVVAGLVLIVGAVVAVRYLAPLTIRTPQSEIRNQAEPAPALPLPDKPSIVVLPFTNMSEDPKQEYFSDGLTEDLTTDLSKISGLFVIARNSAFTYKGKSVKVQEVGRELGVRYVLEGSVRKSDSQVRINAQLIDTTTGGHLWSERYDRPLQDVFTLQDEIRQKIIFALKVMLTEEEQARFRRFPTNNLEAYDYLLRGREASIHAWNEFRKEANLQARQLFEKAIELDPQYAAAYTGLGLTYFLEWFFQWSPDPHNQERALELMQRAIALDDSLSLAHRVLGDVYVFKRQHEQGIAEIERAIALDPSYAENYLSLARTLVYAGQLEEGIGLMEKAMRLDPRNPALYLGNMGWAYRSTGRCEEAIAPLKRVLSLTPAFVPSRVNLAVCYIELGREEEARAEAAEVLRLNPNFSVEKNWRKENQPFKNDTPAVLERLYAAARKAGLK